MNVDSAELVSCGDAGTVGMIRAIDSPRSDGPCAAFLPLGRRSLDCSLMPSHSRDGFDRRAPNSRGLGDGFGEAKTSSPSDGGASMIAAWTRRRNERARALETSTEIRACPKRHGTSPDSASSSRE